MLSESCPTSPCCARTTRLAVVASRLLAGILAVAGGATLRAETGVDVTIEPYAALSGGADQGAGLHGLALVHSDFVSKAKEGESLHWSGYASILALQGRGPTERHVGDFLAASNIEGFNSVRLYSWWIERGNDEWSIRAGALLADEEFTGTDGGGNLINSAFGWPTFISANTRNTGPAFYVAAPGIRFQHALPNGATWRLGVYDGDAFDDPDGDPHVTRHGLHYSLGGDQGCFVISEFTVAPTNSATRYAVGAWLHTARFDDQRDDANGQPFVLSGDDPRSHRGNYGIYGSIQHALRGEAGKPGYIDTFVRAGTGPADRNTVAWAVDAGVTFTGLIPGRPEDVLALGVAHARFSSGAIASARLAAPGEPELDFEQAWEASYTLTINPHCTIQPDLQYIRHPGGTGGPRDAVVAFVRLNFTP